MQLTKDKKGVVVRYIIEDEPTEHTKTVDIDGKTYVVATEVLFPERSEPWARATWREFLKKHLHKSWHSRINTRSAESVVRNAAAFDVPEFITHRCRPDGKSIIHRKQFVTGRIE